MRLPRLLLSAALLLLCGCGVTEVDSTTARTEKLERIAVTNGNHGDVYRLKAPGGWIYFQNGSGMTFVQEPK